MGEKQAIKWEAVHINSKLLWYKYNTA